MNGFFLLAMDDEPVTSRRGPPPAPRFFPDDGIKNVERLLFFFAMDSDGLLTCCREPEQATTTVTAGSMPVGLVLQEEVPASPRRRRVNGRHFFV